jgi:hypothetical protein
VDYKFLAGWKTQVALAPVHKRERPPERGYNAADRTPQRKSTLLENQVFWGGSMLAGGRWLGVLLLGMSLAAEAYAAPLIDNERVTVWDVSLSEGVSGPRTPENEDTVILFLEGGQIRTVDRTGKARIVMRNFGDAVFVPKGTDAIDTLVSGGPAHEIMISLKDHPVPAIANTSGYPTAFPRAGSVKMLDNSRFTAWHYSWTKGVPTGMHFHDKDFVVAFRYDSMQSILAPDGASHLSPVKAGDILFLKRGLTHSEGLTTDRQSAVYLELK